MYYYHDKKFGHESVTPAPEEAIMLTDAEHADIFSKLSEGYVLEEDTAGRPVAVLPPLPSLAEARSAKLAEIVAAANAVKAALSSRYSALEESTWPEQEAGARAILDDAENVKDKTARLILLDAAGRDAAVALVARLAAADGAERETFAARITANADAAHAAGVAALLEQRSMEAEVRNAKSVEEVRAVEVGFSVVG